MAEKKGVLPKNGGSLAAPSIDKGPPMPKRVTIEKAEGGYSIRKSGGSHGYSEHLAVATTHEEVMKCLEWLDGKGKSEKY